MFLFTSDKYPEVELLDHMVVLFLIFRGAFVMLSILVVPIYISSNIARKFLFLYANACYCLSFFFLEGGGVSAEDEKEERECKVGSMPHIEPEMVLDLTTLRS